MVSNRRIRCGSFLQGSLCLAFLICCSHTTVSGQEVAELLRKPFWMQGRQVRKAFSPVVAQPQFWTVKLLKEETQQACGTIVSGDGWIITKASQLADAKECQFADGKRLPFKTVGVDTKLDLALLKVEAKNLKAATWETQAPVLGEWMISVDSRDLPLAIGVLSVGRRSISRSDVRGVLGIQLEMIEKAVIDVVFPKSGGQAAGLMRGDEILQVNQTEIRTRRHLVETIATYRPGDNITLKIVRGDETLSVSATLTHPFGEFLSRIAFQEQMGGPLSFRRDDFEAVYQHDTVLKPEECGGPVVNLDGKAIGINIARASRTASYILPADLILNRLEELKSGKFPPPSPSPEPAPAATQQESAADSANEETN